MANLSDLQQKIDYIVSGPRRLGAPIVRTALTRPPTALAAPAAQLDHNRRSEGR